MFEEKRKPMSYSDSMYITCEDVRLANFLKLYVKNEYAIKVVPFTSHNPKKYKNNSDYSKNELLKVAEENKDIDSEWFIVDKDYENIERKKVLIIDYYAIENYVIYNLPLLFENEETSVQNLIKDLYSDEVRMHVVGYNNERTNFNLKQSIHPQYYEYIDSNIRCRDSFLKYLKLDKKIYNLVISQSPNKKILKKMDKYNATIHEKFEKENVRKTNIFNDFSKKQISHSNLLVKNLIIK